MKIGVGVTTHNRPETFRKTYDEIIKYLPRGTKLVVVDDASEKPIAEATYRFENNVGVARAKNKCLELLDDCEHIFLFDDDCYPKKAEWWKPYVRSPEPHLMYQFKLASKPKNDMTILYKDKRIVAYSHTRGCMLYIDHVVLETVGGMDTAYGVGMYEHTDWTNRIHNASLTSLRAMDVPGSRNLLYCLDQDNKVESALGVEVKRLNAVRNHALYRKSKSSKAYKEYK